MAHWRSMVGQRTWFDVADLGGKDLLVQIESAKAGVINGVINGRKQETRAVSARLVGHERPLALKTTMCKSIASIYGTGEIDQWAGKWIWLFAMLVNDPSGGPGAKCEAVRIKPVKPTDQEIAAAEKARGGGGGRKAAPPPAPSRNEAHDDARVALVCEAIDAALSPQEVEAAIAPNRDELKKMDARRQSIVASAKKARLDALGQPGDPPAAAEGPTP